MTEVKTFSVKRSNKPPHEFKIELEKEDGTTETRQFHARAQVPATVILDLVASGSIGTEWQAAAIRQFFHKAIVDAEREDFLKVLDESDPPVDMPQLTEIINWLVELYGERPTSSA